MNTNYLLVVAKGGFMEPTKPKTSLGKIILGVLLFPITLTYLIWKSKWDIKLKVGATAGLWLFFIIMGATSSSSDSSQSTTNTTSNTQLTNVQPAKVVPSPVSLEQKQSDFKELYTQYKAQLEAMVLLQTSIQQLANLSTNKAELYLGLEKIEQMQTGVNNATWNTKIPDSLKEYSALKDGMSDIAMAGINFSNTIKQFKEYVNKEDLKNLSSAKEHIDQGVALLDSSKAKVDSVARELELDPASL